MAFSLDFPVMVECSVSVAEVVSRSHLRGKQNKPILIWASKWRYLQSVHATCLPKRSWLDEFLKRSTDSLICSLYNNDTDLVFSVY